MTQPPPARDEIDPDNAAAPERLVQGAGVDVNALRGGVIVLGGHSGAAAPRARDAAD